MPGGGVNTYPETSALLALYVPRASSPLAAARLAAPIFVSSLTRFEARQAIRFEIWRNKHDRAKGITAARGNTALAMIEADFADTTVQVAACDFSVVHELAEILSRRYAIELGARTTDLIHVAAALHLGCREFLSFDHTQNKVAAREGLKTPFAAAN